MPWVQDLTAGGWLPLSLAVSVVLTLAVALWRRHLAVTRSLRAELEVAHSRLDDAIQRDTLTGLPSRAGLERVLQAAVSEADRKGGQVCIVAVGLDNLPTIGEAFGTAAADALVQAACQRLLSAAPEAGSVGRLGAGEFAVVMAAEGDDPVRGRALARRVLAELSRPIAVEGRDLGVACSVGIALYPAHGARQALLGRALTAMRHVRMAGGASFAEYLPSMDTDLREQAELAADLRMALERHELSLVYQPKVDAASLQITAAEALLRWQHPVRGVVSPVVFIPVAERYGLIGAIGHWVVQEAARQAAVWRDNGLRMRVAINVSGYQFRQDDFVPRLEAALKRHGLNPARFTCEITETVAMEDTRVTK
jgi:diguanylate cyclase (GGDEF)-like protein